MKTGENSNVDCDKYVILLYLDNVYFPFWNLKCIVISAIFFQHLICSIDRSSHNWFPFVNYDKDTALPLGFSAPDSWCVNTYLNLAANLLFIKQKKMFCGEEIERKNHFQLCNRVDGGV